MCSITKGRPSSEDLVLFLFIIIFLHSIFRFLYSLNPDLGGSLAFADYWHSISAKVHRQLLFCLITQI